MLLNNNIFMFNLPNQPMKNLVYPLPAVILSTLIIFSSCNDDKEVDIGPQLPVITYLSKNTGYPGDSIFIFGEHLDRIRSITINDKNVKVVRESDPEIIFIIDDQTSSGNLVIDFEDETPSFERFFKVYDLTWDSISVMPQSLFRWYCSYDFADANTGFFSHGGTISKTTDGGKNWHTILNESGLCTFQVVNENMLWVQQDSWTAQKTINSGDSWTEMGPIENFWVNETHFIDETKGWTIGTFAGFEFYGVLKTDDGGITWNESYKTNKRLFNYRHTKIFDFPGGFVIIPDLGNGLLLKTVNDGEDWEEITMNFGHAVFYSDLIRFSDEDHGWLLSNYGLFKSDNGGRDWTYVDVPLASIEEEIVDLHFFDNENGILLSDYGAVLKTHDGGTSWTLRYIEASLESVDYLDEDRTIIGWTGRRLMKSQF